MLALTVERSHAASTAPRAPFRVNGSIWIAAAGYCCDQPAGAGRDRTPATGRAHEGDARRYQQLPCATVGAWLWLLARADVDG